MRASINIPMYEIILGGGGSSIAPGWAPPYFRAALPKNAKNNTEDDILVQIPHDPFLRHFFLLNQGLISFFSVSRWQFSEGICEAT